MTTLKTTNGTVLMTDYNYAKSAGYKFALTFKFDGKHCEDLFKTEADAKRYISNFKKAVITDVVVQEIQY